MLLSSLQYTGQPLPTKNYQPKTSVVPTLRNWSRVALKGSLKEAGFISEKGERVQMVGQEVQGAMRDSQ